MNGWSLWRTCNVDPSPEDLKVAQLRGRSCWTAGKSAPSRPSRCSNESALGVSMPSGRRGPVIRFAPDSLFGFCMARPGVIERTDGRKVGFIGTMNETRHGWQQH